MSTVFVNATQARRDTRNQGAIHAEVRAIESSILANIDAGRMYAIVSSGTTMTTSNVYFNVYNGISSNATILDQITCTKQYFLDLQYAVNILTNPGTNNTLQWNISW